MRFPVALRFAALAMIVLVIAPALVQADVFSGKVIVAAAGKVTIVDKDGDNESFFVLSETKITLNGKPSRLDQLKPGDTVNITATGSGEKMTASLIEARTAE